MSDKAIINLEGKPYELPVITGTENEKAVDISKPVTSAEGVIVADKTSLS